MADERLCNPQEPLMVKDGRPKKPGDVLLPLEGLYGESQSMDHEVLSDLS